jgi:hypothetical protein
MKFSDLNEKSPISKILGHSTYINDVLKFNFILKRENRAAQPYSPRLIICLIFWSMKIQSWNNSYKMSPNKFNWNEVYIRQFK